MDLPSWNWYGTGIILYGYRHIKNNIYEVDRWISLFWFPLMPMGTWLIRPISSEAVGTGVRREFHILEKRSTSHRLILHRYLLGIGIYIAAIAPIFIWFWILKGILGGSLFSMILLVLFIIWPVVILGIIDHKIEAVYDRITDEQV